jgi:hypothetical protein
VASSSSGFAAAARVPRRPTGARVSVLPDWVCEVLSSNRRKDLVEKRARLHDAGVGHSWIVDPEVLLTDVIMPQMRLGGEGAGRAGLALRVTAS